MPSDSLKSSFLIGWWAYFWGAQPETQIALVGGVLAILYTLFQFWVARQRAKAAKAREAYYNAMLENLDHDPYQH